ncbi:MAG TPA: sugar nucleotide-binding protein [Myxococcales bacterium]|jgi:3,5-epimerase/4-reductase
MILLIGRGYVGTALAEAMKRRHLEFQAPGEAQLDATRFEPLLAFLKEHRPEFVVCAAGFTGRPNVDACETKRADTLAGNVLLPATLAHACAAADVPFGHVSSGCIYTGAKVVEGGATRVEKDLLAPQVRERVEKDRSIVRGFHEDDAPNFSFRDGPCSFYSGTKALGEEAVAGVGRGYLWRLRIPFDEIDSPRNYLTKLQAYPKVYDNYNSLSHLGDFAEACIDLWVRRAPFGTYNVTNPGFVSARQVVGMIQRILKPRREFAFWSSDEEFYKTAAKTPRSNTVLDSSKLLATGVKLRPVEEALEAALKSWKKA